MTAPDLPDSHRRAAARSRLRCLAAVPLLLVGLTLRSEEPEPPASTETGPEARVAGHPALDRIDELIAAHRPEDAEAAARALLAAAPGSAAAHLRLVEALIDRGEIEAARTAAAAAPAGAARSAALGEIARFEARFEDAEANYRAAVAADPELARAHLGLGRVLSSAGLRRSARLAYERAYSLDPSDRSVLWSFAVTRSDPVARRLLTELLERTHEPDTRGGLERAIARLAALDGREACRADPPRAVEIELAESSGHLGLEVVIGGRKTELLLDTGAPGVAVAERAVRKARLGDFGTSRSGGFGAGDPVENRSALADLELGGLLLRDCTVEVQPRSAPRVSGYDGLIGLGPLIDFLVTLDAPARTLRLEPLPPLPAAPAADVDPWFDHDREARAGFLPLRAAAGDLLLPVRVLGSGGEAVDTLFVLDTGAATTVLDRAIAERVSSSTRRVGADLRGASGKILDVRAAPDVTLQFAGFRQTYAMVAVIDFSERHRLTGVTVGGLLGWDALQHLRLTFDRRNAQVRFERAAR